MRRIFAIPATTALAVLLAAWSIHAQEPAGPSAPDGDSAKAKGSPSSGPSRRSADKKFRDFHEVTEGSERLEGLFTLHRKDDHLYAEIRPNQFDQPLLAPIAIARGMALAGQPLNFGDEWVLVFHRAGDRIQLIRRNIHYKAPSGTPLEKAVKQNYTDSILLALPIVSINPAGQTVLIDLGDIFLGDFAEIGIGPVDRSRTTWHKVKAFPNNLELEVETTFGHRGGGFNGGVMSSDSVIDSRGITLVIHYSLVKMPDHGYHARYADDRVGHFLSAVKDFGLNDPDTTFVRQINRWRLEKSDPKAKLSPPKRRMVWWVEETVPDEYRPYVEAGILEWNKAFEKVGFRNAIEVRWQDADRLNDAFDPEDINYCTFRWITTPQTYAMSCLRANPITGELIDGDVIFDASWIRHWKNEYALLTGSGLAAHGEADMAAPTTLAVGEVISPILAAKRGYGLPVPVPGQNTELALDLAGVAAGVRLEVTPSGWSNAEMMLRKRLAHGQFASCQLSSGMRPELGLAAIALAEAGKADPSGKIPEEFLGQAIKEVVMHEVGHSLGLRHNFKASTMLRADQLNDTAITRAKGITGSVMDYNPINLAPRGQKQGDYYTTTIGPYDYWAIEYAYKPVEGNEEAELKKIAARSPEADLVYGTDEDMMLDNDPLVHVYDLGADPCQFARDRMTLASQLMKDIETKLVRDGEAWGRLRSAFGVLLTQWGNAATLASAHIGGQSVSRDHKATEGARDPIVPVAGSKQREALRLLVDEVFSDKSFKFSPALLRKLAIPRWAQWGDEGLSGSSTVDFPINERVLAIQRIALGHCFDSGTLSRLQNQELMADPGAEPLRMDEVFRALTDGIWSECPKSAEAGRKVAVPTMRRNLQREHLRRLSMLVLGSSGGGGRGVNRLDFVFFNGGSTPADARSLARLHLKEIDKRIASALEGDNKVDDTTRAHLEECQTRINKVLQSSLNTSEP